MKIEIRNLKKVFGTKTAVDIEKTDIHDGEILGLVGNNGAGKTTLFRLILDLLNADEGSVMLTPNMTDGTEPTHINPAMSEDWKPSRDRTLTAASLSTSLQRRNIWSLWVRFRACRRRTFTRK